MDTNRLSPQVHGQVYKVQRFCVNDGPGIRTTVFLKGCQLSCPWCHNPETISSAGELMLNRGQCVLCGRCVEVCSAGVHIIVDGVHRLDRVACVQCGRCEVGCPQHAIELVGRAMSVSEVMGIIRKDEVYYDESAGGVTVSGGEPLLQAEFVRELARQCHEAGFSFYVDTNGAVEAEIFLQALADADGVLFDLKMIDAEKHRRFTGVDPEPILANFRRLLDMDKDVIVRHVLAPGMNDAESDRAALADFLTSVGFKGKVELLGYHTLGVAKYRHLDRDYKLDGVAPLQEPDLIEACDYLAGRGLNVSYR